MTKQLAPIEELAKQAGGKLVESKTDMSAIEWFFRSDKERYDCLLTFQQLEQLRKAIIRDFVSTREPVAWATKASITNAISGNDVIVGKKVKQGRTIEVLRDIAIYDLSEWSNK